MSQALKAKKLAALSIISVLMTASMEALQKILYIWYLILFLNNLDIYVLLDSESEVNTMTLIYVAKSGFVT